MDDKNNSIGIGHGKNAKNRQECVNLCLLSVYTGQTTNSYRSGSSPNYGKKYENAPEFNMPGLP